MASPATELALFRPPLAVPAALPAVVESAEGESTGPALAREACYGYAVSAVLHVCAILVLAAAWISPDLRKPALVIDSREADEVPNPAEFTNVLTAPLLPADLEFEGTAATSTVAVETARALAESPAEPGEPDSSQARVPAGEVPSGAGAPGGGSKRGLVSFFDEEAEGSSVVFIVDASNSMAGDRFARARRELSKSLQLLAPDQKFFIIFFNDRAIPLFDPHHTNELVSPDELTLRKTRRWLLSRQAIGHTVPDDAFRLALSLKPNVIFFLTDGQLPPHVEGLIRELNVNDTVIHTIAFQSVAGEPVLKAIADANRGRYRFVK